MGWPRWAVAGVLAGAGAMASLSVAAEPTVVSQAGPIALGPNAVRIDLPAPTAAASLRGARFVLRIDGLSTDRTPGVLYQVAVDEGGRLRPLGYLNFFNAASGGPAVFFFDLGALSPGTLTIVLTPEDAPEPGAHPRIASLTLQALSPR